MCVSVGQIWELFPTVLLLFTIARGKRGTRASQEPTFGKFGVENIAESPKLTPGRRRPLLDDDHFTLGANGGHDGNVGADGHDAMRGRSGSVQDAIARGDAQYGAFQGNIFGLSPAWYTSSETHPNGDVPSSYGGGLQGRNGGFGSHRFEGGVDQHGADSGYGGDWGDVDARRYGTSFGSPEAYAGRSGMGDGFDPSPQRPRHGGDRLRVSVVGWRSSWPS